MSEQSEHLNNAQIENYGSTAPGNGLDQVQQDELARIEAHLNECPSCRSRLLGFQRSYFALLATPRFEAPRSVDSKSLDQELSSSNPADINPADQGAANSNFAESRLTGNQASGNRFTGSQQKNSQQSDQTVSKSDNPDCPSRNDLRQLAAGLLSSAEAEKIIRHAGTCDHCGSLLRTYTEDFSDDLTQEEQAVLSQLQSTSPSWQKNTARQILQATQTTTQPKNAGAHAAMDTEHAAMDTEHAAPGGKHAEISDIKDAANTQTHAKKTRTRQLFRWQWQILIPAAAAASALVVFGIWFTQRDTPEKVEKLFAQAYTQQRTLEMRIPYAEYSDFKETRSASSQSFLSSPAALRKAADRIDVHLQKNPDSSTWLLLKAQLDLLDWHYKPALLTLDKIAGDEIVHSSEFRMTKSLALYEKAEIEHDPQPYRDVIDLMGQTLQKNPNDPVALFNQAIACEKVNIIECAAKDFSDYLRIDPHSGWSNEARNHLTRIQEKKTPGS